MVYDRFTMTVKHPTQDSSIETLSTFPVCWRCADPEHAHSNASGSELNPVTDLDDPQLDDKLGRIVRLQHPFLLLRNMTAIADIQRLDTRLSLAEAEGGLPRGRARIIACPSDTPESALLARDFRNVSRRLTALLWDGRALYEALGFSWSAQQEAPEPVRQARSLFLLSAAAARIPIVDGETAERGHTDFAAACQKAAADGFHAMLARHEWQCPIIMSVFRRDQTAGRFNSNTSEPPSE